jgi:tetratricopeptide (TPR) repeat protein
MKMLAVRTLAILGLVCTLLSARLLWHAVPIGMQSSPSGNDRAQIATPWITPYYQAAAVVVAGLVVVFWLIGAMASKRGAMAVGLWLAALLTYPYAVMVWDPWIAGNAAWLEAQHRNLIWYGGDVNTTLETRMAGSVESLYVVDTPRQISPTMLAEWQPAELELDRLPDLVDRLGYSNKFFEFLRSGWAAAMAGGVLLMIAICCSSGSLELGRAIGGGLTLVAAAASLCLLGWGWSFLAAADLAAAAQLAAGGQYRRALERLDDAADKTPSLREDSGYIAQVGLLEDGLGLDTPAARLYRADILARTGRLHQADAICERLMQALPARSPLRREACRIVLRSADDALNAGRGNEAVRQLELVLAYEPCNIKASYSLQIAYYQTSQYEPISRLAKRMDAVYRYFQFQSKQSTLSAAYRMAMAANHARSDPDSAILEFGKAINPW